LAPAYRQGRSSAAGATKHAPGRVRATRQYPRQVNSHREVQLQTVAARDLGQL